MSTVALIPARGGSKGIPKKNIKNIAGKPLIAWSIEHALNSSLVDKVFVSTDCPEIASYARKYGAEVPFMRPAEISGDQATTESVMLHFYDWLKDNNHHYENLMLIQATSPVRSSERLDDAIRFFIDHNYDSLVSVANSHRFFWRCPEYPVASYDYMKRPRRQDIAEAEKVYMETGSFYITKMKTLYESKNRLCGRIGMYCTPEIESYEIDTLMDFKICELILLSSLG